MTQSWIQVPFRRRPGLVRTAAAALVPATALALAVLLASGCARGQKAGFTMPPMPVETSVVTQQDVMDRFSTVGTVDAGEAITVVSEIDAKVIGLPFREGQAVARGGLIARLDDEQLRAEAARARALRDQSRLSFDRIKSIVEQHAAAQEDLDNAAAALKVAQANLDLAQARLSKTRITAPFSGILGARRVSPGAFLRAGAPITDLARIDEIKVSFSAPERYLSHLSRGAEVAISTTAYPGYALRGHIDVVEPVLDPATRSARLLARVANPGGRFRPGMSADVSAALGQRARALTVPSEAVFVEGDQAFVYVVKPDSTVTRSALTLGTRLTDVVEVTQGLEAGQRVVRAGHQKLFEGAKVIPVSSAGAPGVSSPVARR